MATPLGCSTSNLDISRLLFFQSILMINSKKIKGMGLWGFPVNALTTISLERVKEEKEEDEDMRSPWAIFTTAAAAAINPARREKGNARCRRSGKRGKNCSLFN